MRTRRIATACILAAACLAVFAAHRPLADESGYELKTLRSRNNGADYIAIAPKQFLKELQPLLDKRAADGLRVAVVTPEQIYDEFPRPPAGPKAIRAFVQYACHNWRQPAPKFLLLVGDINVTDDYDPKGTAMPTFMIHSWQDPRDAAAGNPKDIAATDAPFGDVDNDEVPDIAVGRIPADNGRELAAMVKKIVDFETNPAPGPWRRRTAAFASTGNFGVFDKTLEELTKRIITNNFDPVFDMSMTYGGAALPYFLLPEEFGPKIIEQFNDGALIVSYIGHGGVTGLSSVCWERTCRSILESEDVGKIGAGGRKAFFFSICCLTGKFNLDRECLAEDLLKNPDGPVGVFAASEVSSPYSNSLISKDLLYFMIRKRPATIGEVLVNIRRALVQRYDDDRKYIDKQYGMVFSRDAMKEDAANHVYMYNYFGDPATRIPYAAETTKIVAPAKANAGETIPVSVGTEAKAPGRLLVTLECDPTEIIYPIRSIERLKGDELARAVRQNYANANNKVAASVETRLGGDGAAKIEIKVPEFIPSGTYFIKTYAWDGTPDSMGIATIGITNPNPTPPAVAKAPSQELDASPDCAQCLISDWRKLSADIAIDRCGRAVKLDPKLAEGFFCLASVNSGKKNYIQASEYYEKARSLDPKAPSQAEILAFIKAKKRDRAVEIANSAGSFQDFNGPEPDADLETNVALFKIKAYSAAEEYVLAEKEFENFIEKHPENAFVLNAMAEVYAAQKKFDRAVKLAKAAKAADQYCRKCLFNYGKYSAEIGQYRDAEAAFEDLIGISPRDADARAELGNVYLKLGDRGNARKMFREALDIESGCAAAKKGLLGLIDPEFFFD